MTYVVMEPNWRDTLKTAADSYYKLILIVGPMGSGKTKLLKEIADYNFHFLNFGEDFSRRVLTRPVSARSVEAEEIAIELVEAQDSKRLAIDNTEVLFENPMHLNPLALLKRLSLDHLVVATWNGRFDDSKLTYGMPGHPAFKEFRYTEQDTFIIVPTEEHDS
jgi:hypothetical protein